MRSQDGYEEVAWEDGDRPHWWTSEDLVWLFKLPDGRGFFTCDLDEACDRLLGEPHLRDVDAVRRGLWSTSYALDEWERVGTSPVQVKRKLLWQFVSGYYEHAKALQAWADNARHEAEQVMAQAGERAARRIGSLEGRDVPPEARAFFDTKPDRYTGKATNGRLTARALRPIARKHRAYDLEVLCQRLVREEEDAKQAARDERQEQRRAKEAERELRAEVDRMRSYLAMPDFSPRNNAEQLAALLFLQMRATEDDEQGQRLSEQLDDFIASDVLRPTTERVDYQQSINALQNLLR